MPTHDLSTTYTFDAVTGTSTAHTVTTTGGNRLIIFRIAMRNGGDSVVSASWNGVALALVTGGAVANATNCRTEIWRLLAPDTGNRTASVTLSATGKAVVTVSSYTDVQQTSTFGTVATATGTSVDPAVTVTSATGEEIVDSLAVRAEPTTATVSDPQVERGNGVIGTAGAAVVGGASDAPGQASLATNWDLSTSRAWATLGVGIRHAAFSSAEIVRKAIQPAAAAVFLFPIGSAWIGKPLREPVSERTLASLAVGPLGTWLPLDGYSITTGRILEPPAAPAEIARGPTIARGVDLAPGGAGWAYAGAPLREPIRDRTVPSTLTFGAPHAPPEGFAWLTVPAREAPAVQPDRAFPPGIIARAEDPAFGREGYALLSPVRRDAPAAPERSFPLALLYAAPESLPSIGWAILTPPRRPEAQRNVPPVEVQAAALGPYPLLPPPVLSTITARILEPPPPPPPRTWWPRIVHGEHPGPDRRLTE